MVPNCAKHLIFCYYLIPALIQLFFTLVAAFGRKKIGAQKIKKQFFSKVKFYSLKAHGHYFTVVIYLATEELQNLVFLLILRSQTYPKASTH